MENQRYGLMVALNSLKKGKGKERIAALPLDK